MDPLSDVLRAVRLNGAFFYAVEATAPWSVESLAARTLEPRILPGSEHLIAYHILTEGTCWAGLSDGPPVELRAGDVIVFPQGDTHVLSHAAGQRLPGDTHAASPDCFPEVVCVGPAGPPTARFVCGFLGCDRRPFNPVLGTLPRMLHQPGPAGGWLALFARQVVEETRARRAGASEVLTRLAELMFIEVVRDHLARLPEGQTGWLAGLRDPVVGAALGRLHAEPARAWTLDALAHEVAASRSRLAERFTALVGQPPMQYLAQWRMQLAAARLAEGSAKVATIAAEVGYDSEAAFSRAFKKLVGVPPGAWRRRA